MSIVLYEFPPTRSVRDRWVLQELQVPFESVVVNLAAGEHRSPAFLAINPAGKLPALVDGGHVVTESAAIALYLADKFAGKGFMPQDAPGRAQVYRWLFFTVTELEQPLWRMAKHRRVYPEALRSPADIELARQDFAPMAAVLEAHMQGCEFVANNRVSVADFVLAYTLDWANEAKLLGSCPALVSYMERMYARPLAPGRIAAGR